MKNPVQKSLQYLRYILMAVFLTLECASVQAQSAPNMSQVNDALEDQTSEVARFALIVSRILAMVAFVLLLANLVFKTVEQSKAIVGFLVVLFIWGLFEIIF